MKGVQLVVGLEVECEYNKEYLHLSKDSYHGDGYSTLGKYFCIERDGSLQSSKFEESDTAEIISRPFKAEKAGEVLTSFQQEILKLAGKEVELDKVLNFNSTAGCHLNFSAYLQQDRSKPLEPIIITHRAGNLQISHIKDLKISRLATFNFCRGISRQLHKNVAEKMGTVFYVRWQKQFHRGYAKAITKENFGRDRLYEYNVGHDNRIEFRSFNLFGVETWGQFHQLIGIAIETIQEAIAGELEEKMPFLKEEEEIIEIQLNDVNERSEAEVELIPEQIIRGEV